MGMEGNYQTEKSPTDTVSLFITMGPWKLLYENDDVYVFIVFSKHNDNPTRFITTMVTGHLEDERLTRHEIVREVLDYDPSEGQDWNWESFELLSGQPLTQFRLLMASFWR